MNLDLNSICLSYTSCFRLRASDGIIFLEDIEIKGDNGLASDVEEYGFIFPDDSIIQILFKADEDGNLSKLKFQTPHSKTKISPELTNRIPPEAIATLSGGGIG